MWRGHLSTLCRQIADTLNVIYTRSNVLKSTYEDTLQHRHVFKGIQERNIPTVCCKIMEAVTWVFPNPAKLHCSPRVPFQRVLAMVEDEKPLFCTLSFFLSLSHSVPKWRQGRVAIQPTEHHRREVFCESWNCFFFVGCKIKPAGFYCIPICVSCLCVCVCIYIYIYNEIGIK